MKISELRTSGHTPSLFSAFLYFDVSFMVWVILGALMPFIATDPSLSGVNLQITPTAQVTQAQPYTLVVKGPQTVAQNPKLSADQPRTVYNLILKAGDPTHITATEKPVEKFVVDNANPATIAAVNATSQLIHIALAPGAQGNPNENVIGLKPLAALTASSQSFQPLANGFSAGSKLLLVGIPLLAAGFWRIVLGLMADRFGSRRTGILGLAVTLLPLAAAYQFAGSYNALEFVAFFLGIAGASFAVALPLASRWYPPHLQGVAMGIAGAGNSGTVLATLFAPLIARAFSWHLVFGLLMIPVALTLIVYAALAKDAPNQPKPSSASAYIAAFTQWDTLWFCILYFVTFGGFVGLSSFINTFFVDQYDFNKATVGIATAVFVVSGSLVRPIGGALADKLGGIKMLTVLFAAVVLCAVGIGAAISSMGVTFVLLFILMSALGMGNGSVFQMVPQRFRYQIGVMTGIVGAAGGVGGYYLNFALGHLKDMTQTYASGFYAFAAIAVVAFVVLRAVSASWQRTWLGDGGVARATDTPRERVLVGTDGAELEAA
jgi:NNP family nitrate/nitrite transporter-like MFS transporter